MKFLNLKENYLIYIALFLIFFISIYLGFRHSIYNQDYHHSFFILSMYIDHQNNFEYFKDIFLQYGLGQTIFYKIIDSFIKINIVTILKVNVVIYAINLIILFQIFKKISNSKISITLITILFLIHPYSIYPWPDYLSGFCLSIFIFFFLDQEKKIIPLLYAILLFLAIFFRSTYLINIALTIIIYTVTCLYFKSNNNLKKIFLILVSLLTAYFLSLIYYKNLYLWFAESIGFISNYAGYTKHTEIYNLVVQYVGREGFIFLKIMYYLFRSTLELFDPRNIKNYIFVISIFFNIFFIIQIFSKKFDVNNFEKKIFFISILGLTGFVQSTMLMEIFRNINSTIGIIVTMAYIIEKKKIYLSFVNSKYLKIFNIRLVKLFIIIYLIILLFNFKFINYDPKNYQTYNNPYFSESKKIKIPIINYYKFVSTIICASENTKVINISNDFAISYLCDDKFVKSKSSMMANALKLIKPNEFERIIINGDLKEHEMLISSKRIEEISNNRIKMDNIILMKQIESPHMPVNWYGHLLYIYKKK